MEIETLLNKIAMPQEAARRVAALSRELAQTLRDAAAKRAFDEAGALLCGERSAGEKQWSEGLRRMNEFLEETFGKPEQSAAAAQVNEQEDAVQAGVPTVSQRAAAQVGQAVTPPVAQEAGLRMLTAQLFLAGTNSWEAYAAAGIGETVFFETMACFSRFVAEHLESTGRVGFDRMFWTPRQLSLRLFRIGTLEYELADVAAGRRIHVHIPGDADLSREALRGSLEAARVFLGRFYPEWADAPFWCESWLLSPALPRLLPPTSRILIFQSGFALDREVPEATDYLEWVYKMTPLQQERVGKNLTREALGALPERTSLQRTMKAYLLQGGKVGVGEGTLRGW